MANYFPVYLESGSIIDAAQGDLVNYVYLPKTVSIIASNSNGTTYATLLPDTNYILTQSVDVTTSTNTVSASLIQFIDKTTKEVYIYTTDAILGVQSAALATGVRVGLESQTGSDSILSFKAGSQALTSYVYFYKGSSDNAGFVLPTSTNATNTTYPSIIKGILRNFNSSSVPLFRNVVLLQSETNNQVTAVSGSILLNNFVGYFLTGSAPITSSRTPLIVSASFITCISQSDFLTQSVIPPTASLWLSQSLQTNVSTTNNAAYSNVFSITGLTTNQRYLVNFYLIGQSALTTTGLQVRAVTGSFYRGTIYSPTSATAFSYQNSADGDNITNLSTAWPANNTKYIVYGEYTFIKGAQDPAIQIRSEINGSAVTAFSGSVVFYKALN